jgi:hypothetical protein
MFFKEITIWDQYGIRNRFGYNWYQEGNRNKL